MIRRPLVLALAIALLPAAAPAADLLQVYQLAREGDPQLSVAENTALATREGAVQARAAMLPQIDGSATIRRSRSEGPSQTQLTDPVTGLPCPVELALERLAAGQAHPPPALRLLAKAQGALAGHAWIWRR